jgi:2-amino-4-hydroxy-6-hydroxymethyldihydropteridine diphosphokinase
LTIPHPRLECRRFVLMPLNELDPLWVHPVLKKSVSRLLEQVEDHAQVQLLFPQPSTRYGSRPTCSSAPGS